MTAPIAQAVVASGPLVLVSGQIALGDDGRVAHPGDAGAQAELALRQIATILATHGCTVTDIVKLTTYLVDMADLDAVRKARARVLGAHAPAATTVAVSALARPGLLVEIDAIATVPPR
jgi:2-iminobutanoate/2-iminopropanoate deaminase